jgi:ComF family protein
VVSKAYFPTSRDLPLTRIEKVFDGLLNLIYPESCFLCAAPLARLKECGICPACWDRACSLRISSPKCPACGLPFQAFEEQSDHLCRDCLLKMPVYSGARSFGYYMTELSRIVQELKFRGRQNLAGLLGGLLAGTYCEVWSREDFDCIVPVPLHSRRKRERGYNQSELLARALALRIALPVSSRALSRVRPTLPQVGLTDTQRQENLRQAFRCAGREQISGKRVLLVDDVMTTGATVSSAASALLDAGALRVSVLTVARAVPGF